MESAAHPSLTTPTGWRGLAARLSPVARLRRRFQRWWQARLPLSDTLQLTQRNVYILPTSSGWMLALTLVVLLVASINYQLNLGYLLTFLLAGSAVVGMHICHANLRGLTLHLKAPEPHFLGTNTAFEIQLSSDRKSPRYGIALAVHGTVDQQLSAQESLVSAVERAYKLSDLRYTKGMDSYLSVLDAQRSLYAAQQGLVALRLAKVANQVRLYAVLGGGWSAPEATAKS